MKRKNILDVRTRQFYISIAGPYSGEANFGECITYEMLRPSFLIPAGTCKSV
jgi:hypothetical protein